MVEREGRRACARGSQRVRRNAHAHAHAHARPRPRRLRRQLTSTPFSLRRHETEKKSISCGEREALAEGAPPMQARRVG